MSAKKQTRIFHKCSQSHGRFFLSSRKKQYSDMLLHGTMSTGIRGAELVMSEPGGLAMGDSPADMLLLCPRFNKTSSGVQTPMAHFPFLNARNDFPVCSFVVSCRPASEGPNSSCLRPVDERWETDRRTGSFSEKGPRHRGQTVRVTQLTDYSLIITRGI